MKDIETLINILPSRIKKIVNSAGNFDTLVEIVLDFQRPLEIRYLNETLEYAYVLVTKNEISYVESKVTSFGIDNRAGIDKTLHRISRIQNRDGNTIGLTIRIGKAIENAHSLILSLLEDDKSILMVGAPGTGKTTILRSAANYLSIEQEKKVIVVDTSDEIAGAGDIPHFAIGKARKMPVPFNKSQHHILIEAVENHWPDTIIVDEISDEKEVISVRSIAKRGVQMLATVHGSEFKDLLSNPPILGLLGGIKTVTISDEQAKLRGTSKSIPERQGEPCFDVVVELVDYDTVYIYHNLKDTIDCFLRGGTITPEEIRLLEIKGIKQPKTVRKYELRDPFPTKQRRQSF